MTEKELEKLWLRLPPPSEFEAERIAIPVPTKETYEHDIPFEAPPFGAVYFRKKYIKGVCVGWELEN